MVVVAALLDPDWLVEIEVEAVLDENPRLGEPEISSVREGALS